MALLTAKQREMLRLTVAAGLAAHWTPRRFHSAWTVRVTGAASVIVTFSDATGAKLVHLGLIELDPDPTRRVIRGPSGVTGRRYMPTTAGIAEANRPRRRRP